jgi:hypothetical protein
MVLRLGTGRCACACGARAEMLHFRTKMSCNRAPSVAGDRRRNRRSQALCGWRGQPC